MFVYAAAIRLCSKISLLSNEYSVTTITIALSKGRIFDETLPLLAAAGIVPAENPETSRKLILPTSDPALRVIIDCSSRSCSPAAMASSCEMFWP